MLLDHILYVSVEVRADGATTEQTHAYTIRKL